MTRGKDENHTFIYQPITGEADHEHATPVAGLEIHRLRRGNKHAATSVEKSQHILVCPVRGAGVASSSPAAPSTNAPVHTEQINFVSLCCARNSRHGSLPTITF